MDTVIKIKIIIALFCCLMIGWLFYFTPPSQNRALIVFMLGLITIFVYLDDVNLIE